MPNGPRGNQAFVPSEIGGSPLRADSDSFKVVENQLRTLEHASVAKSFLARIMRKHVEFDYPPVVEVLIGFSFSSQSAVTEADLEAFGRAVESEYPDNEPKEVIKGNGQEDSESKNDRPDRRIFISSTGDHVIQLQDDLLLLDWHRDTHEEEYQTFARIYKEFLKIWRTLDSVMSTASAKDIAINRFYLFYINVISAKTGLTWNDPSSVLAHLHYPSTNRGLPRQPRTMELSEKYDLPDETGTVEVSAWNTSTSTTSEPTLRLDLYADGAPERPRDVYERWFEAAHKAITLGFADVTTTTAQSIWGAK